MVIATYYQQLDDSFKKKLVHEDSLKIWAPTKVDKPAQKDVGHVPVVLLFSDFARHGLWSSRTDFCSNTMTVKPVCDIGTQAESVTIVAETGKPHVGEKMGHLQSDCESAKSAIGAQYVLDTKEDTEPAEE